jgi:YidC/Oxa1 family membrane protein insertase
MELQPQYEQDSQQRTFLVLLLILAMFFIWSTVFAPRPTPPKEEPVAEGKEDKGKESPASAKAREKGKGSEDTPTIGKAEPKAPDSKAPAAKKGGEEPPEAGEPAEPEPSAPEPELKKVVRSSKLLHVTFTNQDAAVERLTLLDYFRTPPSKSKARRLLDEDPDADVSQYGLPLLGQVGAEPSAVISDRTQGSEGEAADLFNSRRYEVLSGADDAEVVFRAVFGDGLQVTKTYRLPSEDDQEQRHLLLDVEVKNVSDAAVEYPGYRLRGAGGLAVDVGPAAWKRGRTTPTKEERKKAATGMGAVIAMRNEAGKLNVVREDAGDLQEEPLSRSEAPVAWSAVQSSYFTVILSPLLEEGEKSWVWAGGAESLDEVDITSTLATQNAVLAPGEAVVHRYQLYAGPKKSDALAAYERGYEEVIAPSKLYYLKVVLYGILRGAHAIIPNYGVAIILLTLVVRLVLHPLSKKSQVSMARMQKLQPQMKDIREKFKKDKQRQQQEMMKLYKEYGVNPLGGCLPMILQIPVFIGLWGVLRESIELRHAPFILWIKDLSQPDAFLGYVNVLPLMCVVVMFLQQRMMPKSVDPQQQQTQKIMGYMMPALLGFLFYGVASGVTLYFSASMGLGVLEQKRIRSHVDQLGDLKPVKKKTDKQSRKAVPSRSKGKRDKRKKPF